MNTTFPALNVLDSSCRIGRLAMALYLEAFRSEGLRLKNSADHKRMASLSVDAARALIEELNLSPIGADENDSGPATGPTAVPEGATNRQESGAVVGDAGLAEDAAKAPSPELGSIESGVPSGVFSVGVTGHIDGDSGRIGLTTILCPDSAVPLSVGGRAGGAGANTSQALAIAIVDKLNALVGHRDNLAVDWRKEWLNRQELEKQVTVLDAERDELAGLVTVLKLEAQDLKEERDAARAALATVKRMEVESVASAEYATSGVDVARGPLEVEAPEWCTKDAGSVASEAGGAS